MNRLNAPVSKMGPHSFWISVLIFCAVIATCFVSFAQTTSFSQLDKEKPIEIMADSLEVKQDQKTAVFQGNVEAIQGNMQLRANELIVHYRDDSGNGHTVNSITRINAKGSVFMTSESETAQGDFGLYDVEKGIMTLTENVVLTRENNVIRGNRLILNLVTGQSKIDGGLDTTHSNGRVKGLFVPKHSTN